MNKIPVTTIEKTVDELAKAIKKIKNTKDRELSIHSLSNEFFNFKNRYLSDLYIISDNLKRGKILEIGSSPYHLTFCLKQLGYDITGVDINPKILSGFQKQYKLKTIKSDIQKDKLPLASNSFDAILLNEVFEHLGVNPLYTLKEIKRVLKPGGIFILTTPNLYALHKIISFNIGRSFNNAYFELKKVETYGYMGHIREYSNKEIKEILEKTGFTVKKVLYRKYNNFSDHPYFKNYLSKFAARCFDLITLTISKFKPFQITISTK